MSVSKAIGWLIAYALFSVVANVIGGIALILFLFK